MPRAGELIDGRFKLERKLGAGAIGEVWLAKHLSLGTPVAVKLIRTEPARNPGTVARFEREAILAARIRSRHVVKVLDHGHQDDLPYIVMEYLEGQSLRDRLQASKRLSAKETRRVVRHVALALDAAHALGLVHRDIKPENIFVCSEDSDEMLKVLDFGVVKVSDELSRHGVDPTRTGEFLGTPFYMSPEQAGGLKSIDHRADLWSLGVVAFECLSGIRPFSATALGPLIAKIMRQPVPKLTEVVSDVGLQPVVDDWMFKALERNPASRFQSAIDMAEAFCIATGSSETAPTEHSA